MPDLQTLASIVPGTPLLRFNRTEVHDASRMMRSDDKQWFISILYNQAARLYDRYPQIRLIAPSPIVVIAHDINQCLNA